MTTETGRLVGRLDVDSHRPDWVPDGESATAPTLYWPRDVYLQNDGALHKWMTEGPDDFRLEHDGVGWVVTRGMWPYDGHTYRLAARGGLIDWLPRAGGQTDAVLDPARRYAIRCSAGPVFDLYEIS